MDATLDVSELSAAQLVNGVFMGGGAKSIAYGGALRAVHERGIWFGSVAGSSAGAIVSALIASGLELDELEAAIPAGLAAARASLPARAGKVIIGHAHSVFEGRGLRAWLETTMATKIGKVDGAPVTFAELHRATGIELYVVAVDLANGLPVVFCRRSTPDVDVAGAVVASGAIPGAFPAGRAVVRPGDEGAVVHTLIDGSAWANYPSFVFQDRSFRAWLRSEAQLVGVAGPTDDAGIAGEDQRPLMGFTLGDIEPLERLEPVTFVPDDGPDISRRFDRGPTFTSPKRFNYLFGAVLSSDWARLILGVALVVWLALSIATVPIAFRRFSEWLVGVLPDPLDMLYPLVLVGALSVVVVAMMSAIAVITLALLAGRIVADTILPTLKAVLGVPLDGPPWLGMGEDSVVVHVPDDGLHTVAFDVTPEFCAEAIERARVGVARQLDDPVVQRRLDALLRGDEPEVPPFRRGERAEVAPPFDERASIGEIVALVAAAVVVGAAAWLATNLAATDRIEWTLAAIAAALTAVVGAVWYVGGRAARRAAGRSTTGVGSGPPPSKRSARLAMAGGCGLLLVGIVLSWSAMGDRSSDTVDAEVVKAEAVTGTKHNKYVLEYENHDSDPATIDTVPVTTERHLRLGEHVFVDPDASELVGALNDPLFPMAVVLWVLAFGLITSGVRSYRWAQRCERLAALVEQRTSG